MSIAENVLDAVDILVEEKVSGLQFNKTIRGKIAEIVDASIGQYKIQYQNSYFTAYAADSNARYSKNSDVYVEILSNDFERNALILGTVRRLGSNYITIVEKLDKYTEIGQELLYNDLVEFSSYQGTQTKELYNNIENNNLWSLDKTAIKQAVENSDSIKLGMHIITDLPLKQQTQGNYGLKVIATYYDEAQRDDIDNRATLDRLYLFDINDMVGQPYRYVGSGSDQYAIFPIDSKNFVQIKSIAAFCEGFPEDATKEDIDIKLSDFSLQFLKELSEEQLNGSFLSINSTKGNYFTATDTQEATRDLVADLRIKGKKVNYNYQSVDFYWFKTNLSIHAGDDTFSPYGGIGWERLNATSLNVYKYTIKKKDCTGADTKFKCVAVFTEGGQTTSVSSILHIKVINGTEYVITSSAGTNFSFNIGQTKLTISPNNDNYYYCWTRSLNGETPEYLDNENILVEGQSTITAIIANPATNLIIYECSIYDQNQVLQGTASITLINNKESLGCTLVINNGTQVFKYDTYGTSPAAAAKATADRMVIPTLSFDIYDKQGNVIQIPENEKKKYMKIRWIWPTDLELDSSIQTVNQSHVLNLTMLTCDYVLKAINIPDTQTGEILSYPGIEDQPTFTYGIRDKYQAELANTSAAHNNIRLEVDYQGEHLVASTNFTFTKEGELGTNGTKYTARIVPVDNDVLDYVICGTTLYQITLNGYDIVDINNNSKITDIIRAELWDGEVNVATDNIVTWSIAKSTTRRATRQSRITIDSNNNISIIEPKNNNGQDIGTRGSIIQAMITYEGKKFYATFPICYLNKIAPPGSSDIYIPYIYKGYREVMYESDGSRGRFLGLSFEPRKVKDTEFGKFLLSTTKTWGGSTDIFTSFVDDPKILDAKIIEPPSYYIAESYEHFIYLKVGGYVFYRPIELYLNRYGMSAMNDWDGNSIQISDKNGGYILAPQIGAGIKEVVKDSTGAVIDNAFTGITIGETFQDTVNADGKSQVGMFGYYAGVRSLFLDARTGDAEFGIAGKGQIKIHASDGQGTIDSGDYKFDHDGGTGKGLKIKFTSTPAIPGDPTDEQGPYIKYGSGNFMVNSEGHITAQGGGTIAGWVIRDKFLRSPDGKTTLYSNDNTAKMQLDNTLTTKAYTTTDSNGNLVDVKWNANRATRFDIGGKFQVNEDGALKSTAGKIGGWFIESERLFSYNTSKETLELNSKGAIYGPYWGTTSSSLYTIIGTFNSATDPTVGESKNQAIVLNENKSKYYVKGPATSESNTIYYYFITQNNANVLQTETTVPTNLSYAGVIMKKPALTDKKITIMPTLDSYVTHSHDGVVDIYLVKTKKQNSLYWEKWKGQSNEITKSDRVRLGAVSAAPTTFPISITLHKDAYAEFEEITDTTKYYKYNTAK